MKVLPAAQAYISNLSFKAGITNLYSDFDGTYFPFSQHKISNQEKNSTDVHLLNAMHSRFVNFIKSAKGKFNITITTGRSKDEMEYALRRIKSADAIFYMPDEYILRDGMSEYRALNDDKATLKRISCACAPGTESVKEIIKSVDDSITVIEPDTNKFIDDYKGKTLKGEFLKLNKDKRERYVSVVEEENGLVELVFSPNVDIAPFVKQLKKLCSDTGEQKEIISFTNDSYTYTLVQTQKTDDYDYFPANVILIKPKINGKVPNKLDLPKKKVDYIVQNNTNDLIVVAGDGSNDRDMLNPLNYLDIFGIDTDTGADIKEILSRRDVLDAIKNLPLVCIIAGNGEDLKDILQIKQFLDNNGIYKIFNAQDSKNELLEKIKLAMLHYSDSNSEYKYGLGYELYEEILK